MEHIDNILVVDDDHDIRELVVDYLLKSGYRATGPATARLCAATLPVIRWTWWYWTS